jgi:O-antigen/teichoic acid export membrane protein
MMVLMRLGERLIGLVSFSITARLLTPVDFGLFALATSVVAVVEQLGRAGLDQALIHRRNPDRRDYDAAWAANILIGAAVAAILCAIAEPAALFFDKPRVALILYFLAAATFIAGFENIGTVQFQKSLEFHRELSYRLSVRVFAAAVTVAAALIWRDFTALVVGFVIGKIGLVGLSFVVHRYRPKFSLAGFTNIAAFSKWVLVRNIIAGLNEHAATFTIGRLLMADALAFFAAAHEMAALATTEILAPVRRALFPGFAALGDDPAAFRRMYFDSAAMTIMLGLPIPVGLAVVAADFVRVFLGPQWSDAAPLIPVLVLGEILSCFASGAQIVFLSLGQPRVTAYLAALRFAILMPALMLGAFMAGTRGVAWALVVAAAVMFFANGFLIRRALQLRARDQWRVCYRSIVAAAIMFLSVTALQSILPAGMEIKPVVFRLFASVAVGATIYAAVLCALWLAAHRPDGAERHALRVVQLIVTRLRRLPAQAPTPGAVPKRPAGID